MMDQHEDRLDRQIQQAAQEYHRPPQAPRDEMWAAIAAARRAERERPRVLGLAPRVVWGIGIAAVLAIGVAIGRFTAHQTGEAGRVVSPVATVDTPSVAFQVVAAQYLTSTEVLLTGFRSQSRGSAIDPQLARSARRLLGTTRLMLESPAAEDPRLKALLEDLELVLAQIARLPQASGTDERELITQGLEQRSVLPRLRSAIPAGPAVRPQGAL
jgi:hypothetical protein